MQPERPKPDGEERCSGLAAEQWLKLVLLAVMYTNRWASAHVQWVCVLFVSRLPRSCSPSGHPTHTRHGVSPSHLKQPGGLGALGGQPLRVHSQTSQSVPHKWNGSLHEAPARLRVQPQDI